MRIHTLLLAALCISVAGCRDLLTSDGTDSVVLSVPTYSDGDVGYLISPRGLVYQDQDIVYTLPNVETCGVVPFVGDEPADGSGPATLDIGPHFLARLPAGEDTLYRVNEFGTNVYRLQPLFAGLPLQPGDTLTISIPQSAQIPATSISIRTAEAFTLDPVAVPASNEPLTVTWQGAALAGSSAMRLSLRYAGPVSGGVLDQQVVCILADDGSSVIDPGFLGGWVNAVDGERQAVATRIRARELMAGSGVRVTIISYFDSPPPLLVQ